jgi:hypothetical protein
VMSQGARGAAAGAGGLGGARSSATHFGGRGDARRRHGTWVRECEEAPAPAFHPLRGTGGPGPAGRAWI